MRTKYKKWAKPFLLEHQDIAIPAFNKNDHFFDSFSIEIGGGKGDFIVDKAIRNPNKHFLMIERVISVAAPAVKKIIENKLDNVRVISEDFLTVSKDIPNHSVNEIFLNFSDPWPKKRHEKRRLTHSNFLSEYARILVKDGALIFKTDQLSLYEFTKTSLHEQNFDIIVDNSNYDILEVDDSLTEYEKKFREKGNKIYKVVAKYGIRN